MFALEAFNLSGLVAGELAQESQRSYDWENYRNRHEIDIADLSSLITDLQIKMYASWALIVDEYVACEPEGMSREEPVMVVSLHKKRFMGEPGLLRLMR